MIDVVTGVLAGFVIGLVPGLHINALLAAFAPDYFFIVPLSIAFVFSSFFPSLLLGVPNAETALSVLPGHKLVLSGRSYSALLICFYSAMIASIASLFSLAVLFLITKQIYPFLKWFVPFALAAIIITFVLRNKKAIVIVALSSSLGIITFSNGGLLMPLLSGFFALSTLVLSFNTPKLPAQSIVFSPRITAAELTRASLLASLLSSVFSMLPAVSSSITATAGNSFGKMKDEEFVSFISATNASYMILSFYAMSALGVYRSGSAALLSQAPVINAGQLAGLVLISSFLAGMLCVIAAPLLLRVYRLVDYSHACTFSMAFIIAINFLLTGFYGLLVMFVACAISVSCHFLNVRRVTCMSALMAPVVFA